MRISSHLTALRFSRGLQESSRAISRSLERLSAAAPRAGDLDALRQGFQTSRIDSRLRGLSQVNGGLYRVMSQLDAANAGIDQQRDILFRLREIAMYGSNQSLTIADRERLQIEVQELLKDFDRLMKDTQFDGLHLLDGNFVLESLMLNDLEASDVDFSLARSSLANRFQKQVATGEFLPGQSLSLGSNPSELVSGDVNRDGFDDLVSLDSSSGVLYSYLSRGDGGFYSAITRSVGANAANLDLVDLDGDQFLDLTLSHGASGFSSVFWGNGDGQFTQSITLSGGANVYSVAGGDLNGDGFADLMQSIRQVGSASASSFVSGLPEMTSFGLFAAPTQEVTTITASAIANQESTNISMAQVGAQEVSEFTLIAAGVREQTQVQFSTHVPATFEVTTFEFLDGASTSEDSYFNLVESGISYYVWFNIDGGGSDPSPGGTGIEVAISSVDSAEDVRDAVLGAFTIEGFSVSTLSTNGITLTNSILGPSADATDVSSGTTIITTTQGANANFESGDYFEIHSGGINYYVWFNIDSAGGDPGLPGKTGIEVGISSANSANTIAAAVQAAVDALGAFEASVSTDTVTMTNTTHGAATDASSGSLGAEISISTLVQGVDSLLNPGDYFLMSSPSTDYYVWFNIEGDGADPSVGGRTGIQVNINYGDSASDIATAVASAIDALGDFSALAASDTVTVTNSNSGNVTDASDGNIGGAFAASTTTQGILGILQNDYFTLNTPAGAYYVWLNIDGGGVDPTPGGTGVEVAISSGDSAIDVATAVESALDPLAEFLVGRINSDLLIINRDGGNVADAVDQSLDSVLSVAVNSQGADGIVNGDYFNLSTPTGDYYVWFNISGLASDPSASGTGIEIEMNWGDGAEDVVTAIQSAFGPYSVFSTELNSNEITITNRDGGSVVDASEVSVHSSFGIVVDVQGVTTNLEQSDYFTFSTLDEDFYVWYNIGGLGVDPSLSGTGIEVAVDWADSASTVASLTAAAIDAVSGVSASALGSDLTITNDENGVAVDATGGNIATLTPSISQQGSATDVDLINNTIRVTGHGYVNGQRVQLSTSDSLPGGLSTSTDYYVRVLDQDRLQFAATMQDAFDGNVIDITGYGVGTQDISVFTTDVQSYQLLAGDGTRSFNSSRQFVSNNAQNRLRLGDLNGDGDLDIVGIESANDVVSLLLSDGEGGFQTQSTLSTINNPLQMRLADLDGDGDLDIISGGLDSNLSIRYSDGEGGFSAASTFFIVPDDIGDFDLADLNGDGLLDVVASDFSDESGWISYNSPSGFLTRAFIGNWDNPLALALGDFNGDAIPDIAYLDGLADTLETLTSKSQSQSAVSDANVLSAESSEDFVEILDQAIESIQKDVSKISALHIRIESAVAANLLTSETLEDVKLRIQEPELVLNIAELIKNQILQQAQIAAQSQSLIQTQMVLKLLDSL